MVRAPVKAEEGDELDDAEAMAGSDLLKRRVSYTWTRPVSPHK